MVDFTAGFEEEVLRPDVTAQRCGLTNRQLRNMEAEGLFPQRFLLVPGGRARGHLLSEVLAWMHARAASRDETATG